MEANEQVIDINRYQQTHQSVIQSGYIQIICILVGRRYSVCCYQQHCMPQAPTFDTPDTIIHVSMTLHGIRSSYNIRHALLIRLPSLRKEQMASL
jgi:hypothetical protein